MSADQLLPDSQPLTLSGDVQHIIELARPLEALANQAGIYNVFDDGGYRTLLLITMFDLKKPPGRLGDDATAADGRTFELKTINLINTKGEERTTYPGITTEHTLRQENINRYRKTSSWLIGVFKGNIPLDVWEVESSKLEPYYSLWETRIAHAPNHEINNPKIPFAFIASVGRCHTVKSSEGIPRLKVGRLKPLPM